MNKTPNTKNKKGITLIALIITIIILLILAVVAISAVTGDGILRHATNARDEYGRAQENETGMLDNYISKIEENLPGGGDGEGGTETEEPDEENNVTEEWETSTTVKAAKASGKAYKDNTAITDEYGNTVTVPAGFKIASDSADDVTGGVVIEDVSYSATAGSQFVWIPVGEVKYEEDGESKTETIILGRYSSFMPNATLAQTSENYEDPIKITGNHSSIGQVSYYEYRGDSIGVYNQEELESYIESATQNGGYYLGRYEARTVTERDNSADDLTQLTCKSSDYIYNYISKSSSEGLCQGMYTSSNFTSYLMNSFAWDTAIIFIQKFDDPDYATSNSPNTDFITAGGTSLDKVCNIYDMAGNCCEYTTEIGRADSIGTTYLAVMGGYMNSSYVSALGGVKRYCLGSNTGFAAQFISFRPILYVAQ